MFKWNSLFLPMLACAVLTIGSLAIALEPARSQAPPAQPNISDADLRNR